MRLGSTVATWLPPARGSPVVVHFHGNGEQLADLAHLVQPLHALGLGVLAVEYPGYGLSTGSPSEQSILEAGEAALALLRDRFRIPQEQTVLQGQSLGTGVAAQLALRGRGSRLVLISPYTSIPELAAKTALLRPFRWLVRDRFDTRGIASRVTIPVLIVHGTDDEVIPFWMGRVLSTAFPKARFLKIDDAHHNDLWEEHQSEVVSAIASFVAGTR